MKATTPEQAVSAIRSGDRVFVHTAAAAPLALLAVLAERSEELRDVEIVQLHTEGPAPNVAEQLAGSFHTRALFVGGNVREAVARGTADYVPIFLSEVPRLFRNRVLPLEPLTPRSSPHSPRPGPAGRR